MQQLAKNFDQIDLVLTDGHFQTNVVPPVLLCFFYRHSPVLIGQYAKVEVVGVGDVPACFNQCGNVFVLELDGRQKIVFIVVVVCGNDVGRAVLSRENRRFGKGANHLVLVGYIPFDPIAFGTFRLDDLGTGERCHPMAWILEPYLDENFPFPVCLRVVHFQAGDRRDAALVNHLDRGQRGEGRGHTEGIDNLLKLLDVLVDDFGVCFSRSQCERREFVGDTPDGYGVGVDVPGRIARKEKSALTIGEGACQAPMVFAVRKPSKIQRRILAASQKGIRPKGGIRSSRIDKRGNELLATNQSFDVEFATAGEVVAVDEKFADDSLVLVVEERFHWSTVIPHRIGSARGANGG